MIAVVVAAVIAAVASARRKRANDPHTANDHDRDHDRHVVATDDDDIHDRRRDHVVAVEVVHRVIVEVDAAIHVAIHDRDRDHRVHPAQHPSSTRLPSHLR